MKIVAEQVTTKPIGRAQSYLISAPHLIDSPNCKYQNMCMWIYFLFLLVNVFCEYMYVCVYICM